MSYYSPVRRNRQNSSLITCSHEMHHITTYHQKDELVTTSPSVYTYNNMSNLPGAIRPHLDFSSLALSQGQLCQGRLGLTWTSLSESGQTVYLIVPGATWTIQGRPGMATSCHNSISVLCALSRAKDHPTFIRTNIILCNASYS